MAAYIFGKELNGTLAIIVYIFLALALLILGGSIYYYWSYARKIERFLARDNENNNMMRQDLIDGTDPDNSWPCSICFHNNDIVKTTCVMCGTPRMTMANVPNSPSLVRASGFTKQDLRGLSATMLNQQSRVRSFHVRRLKQMDLNSRQKAAVRRHLWKRQSVGNGALQWVRIDAPRPSSRRTERSLNPEEEEYDILQSPRRTGTNGNVELSIILDGSRSSDTPSDTDSVRMANQHVARALLDFGGEGSLENDERRQRDVPLRATALKQLDEAEERPTMVGELRDPNPYSIQFHRTESPMDALMELDEQQSDTRSIRSRGGNSTTVSTGYVRHENADGHVEFTPATGLTLSVQPNATQQQQRHVIQCDDDLEEIAALTFHEKNRWFLQEVQKRWRNYEEGHIQFVVRREEIVADSMEQMLKCPASRFWERLRIYFENEPGLDAGGLIREWYELLSETLFNDDFGLFIATKGENLGYWINPASASKISDDLMYFEFVGRLLAKALIEGYNMKMSLSLPLIKHMLGVPISFSDLEFLDEELYKNAKWLKENDHAELLNLDFTVQVITSEGKSETVELKPGGASIDVTDTNKREYVELLLKHYMFGSVHKQLGALLKGFYDIVPAFLVTVFDYQEFDLLLSGIPDIDIADWHMHTEVRWIKLERPSAIEQRVLKWFWQALDCFSPEERARLLQFATGTSRVPVQGFKALTSSDGRVRRFTIQFVQRGPPPTGLMPKGHTCFNRIDVPLYDSLEELMNYLTLVINMEITGFWLE